jgi:hypothetical protein
MTDQEVTVGSRWYAWGHHWKVIAEAVRDGEPAVKLEKIDRPRRGEYNKPTVLTRLVARHGVPIGG